MSIYEQCDLHKEQDNLSGLVRFEPLWRSAERPDRSRRFLRQAHAAAVLQLLIDTAPRPWWDDETREFIAQIVAEKLARMGRGVSSHHLVALRSYTIVVAQLARADDTPQPFLFSAYMPLRRPPTEFRPRQHRGPWRV
jgi:hypothetical protein